MTKRRTYRLGKRAVDASSTRRRIVEATLELHDEQGITGTSFRDVASRAGVAPSTVLHHFATMDALIQACGQLANDLVPIPTVAILSGAADAAERVRRTATAMFEWHDAVGPGLDHLRVDRRRIPDVDNWMAHLDEQHRALAAAALAGQDSRLVDLLVALTTPDAWTTFRTAGDGPVEAAHRVAAAMSAMTFTPRRERSH